MTPCLDSWMHRGTDVGEAKCYLDSVDGASAVPILCCHVHTDNMASESGLETGGPVVGFGGRHLG